MIMTYQLCNSLSNSEKTVGRIALVPQLLCRKLWGSPHWGDSPVHRTAEDATLKATTGTAMPSMLSFPAPFGRGLPRDWIKPHQSREKWLGSVGTGIRLQRKKRDSDAPRLLGIHSQILQQDPKGSSGPRVSFLIQAGQLPFGAMAIRKTWGRNPCSIASHAETRRTRSQMRHKNIESMDTCGL